MKNTYTIDGVTVGSLEDVIEYCWEHGYCYDESDIEEYYKLVTVETLNPENDQRLVTMVVPEEDKEYYQSMVELSHSSKYTDYKDTAADKVEKNPTDENIKEYNGWIKKNNKYSDLPYYTR